MSGFLAYKFAHRHGVVSLRYVAAIFFLLSQLATFFVIAHYLEVADLILQDTNNDVIDLFAVYTHAKMFRIEGGWGTFLNVMRSLGSLVIPLYFVATVSFVLNLKNDSLGELTARNALIAIIFFLVETIVIAFAIVLLSVLIMGVCFHLSQQFPNLYTILSDLFKRMDIEVYGESLSQFGDPSEAAQYILISYILTKIPSLNIFIDLFLCLSICIFVTVRPKWANRKWKLRLFRAGALLPIGYVISAFLINGLSHSGYIWSDSSLLTMIPARTLPVYLFFGCIILCHRMQAKPPMRVWENLTVLPRGDRKILGDTAVLETRREAHLRALRMAIFLSVCLFLISMIDLCFHFTDFGAKWGLGKSYYAACGIPFLFFFDDRKPVKRKYYTIFSVLYFLLICVIVVLYIRAIF